MTDGTIDSCKCQILLVFFVLVFYSFSNSYAKPPYDGTIFYFPDVINSNDPTTFQELIYVGQDHREMFDCKTDLSKFFCLMQFTKIE